MPSPRRSAIGRDDVHVRSDRAISDEAWAGLGPGIEGQHRDQLNDIASRYWTWKNQTDDQPTEGEGNATLRHLNKDLDRFDTLARHERSILFACLTQISGGAGERFFHHLSRRAQENSALNPLEPETFPLETLKAALLDALITTSGPRPNALVKQTVAEIAGVYDQVHHRALTHSNGSWGAYQQRSASVGGGWVTAVMLDIDPDAAPTEISAALADYIKRRNGASPRRRPAGGTL